MVNVIRSGIFLVVVYFAASLLLGVNFYVSEPNLYTFFALSAENKDCGHGYCIDDSGFVLQIAGKLVGIARTEPGILDAPALTWVGIGAIVGVAIVFISSIFSALFGTSENANN